MTRTREKKTFLDLFLDNVSTPKKKGNYFGEKQEQAIIKFNDLNTTNREKSILFQEIIDPAFRDIIKGVLEMKKFHHLGGLNREDVIENTFYRLVEKMGKFTAGLISKKSGLPVKAFSYFSTIAKNHFLEQKLRHGKVLLHKADVESSIDLTILSEDTLSKMSNYDKQNVEFYSRETEFIETSLKVIIQIDKVINTEEAKDRPDADLIKLGHYLKYFIRKWDKIDFMKKNEFMRILALYSGFKQQQVSLLFKKFKLSVLENLNPSLISKNKTLKVIDVDEDEDLSDIINENGESVFDESEFKEDEGFIIEVDESEFKEDEGFITKGILFDQVIEEKEETGFKYEINTMEDFDIESERLKNDQIKSKWKK